MSVSEDVWAARRTPCAAAETEMVPGSKRRSDLSQEGSDVLFTFPRLIFIFGLAR